MDTRHALLDAAEDVARRRGYDGFSYADLAGAVGIRKASIHHHFSKKADLTLALIGRYAEHLGQRLAAIEEAKGTGLEALLAFVDLYREALSGGQTVCLCVALSTDRESLDQASLSALKAFNDEVSAWLRRQFNALSNNKRAATAQATAEEAQAALALVQGAHLLSRAAGSTAPYDLALAPFLRQLRATDQG